MGMKLPFVTPVAYIFVLSYRSTMATRPRGWIELIETSTVQGWLYTQNPWEAIIVTSVPYAEGAQISNTAVEATVQAPSFFMTNLPFVEIR